MPYKWSQLLSYLMPSNTWSETTELNYHTKKNPLKCYWKTTSWFIMVHESQWSYLANKPQLLGSYEKMYLRAIYSFIFVVIHKSHLETAKCLTNGTRDTEAGHLSELYALSSCSRWEWDNLANITAYDFISPLLCQLCHVSATLLFNFLPDSMLLSSTPLCAVAIPQLSSTLATLHYITHLNHTTAHFLILLPVHIIPLLTYFQLPFHNLWVEQPPWYFNISLHTELHAEKIHQWCHLTCKNSFQVSLCSNINSLKTKSVRPCIRTLRALTGLNGRDQPHLGPPWTHHAYGSHLSSESSALAWATLLNAPASSPGSGSCLQARLDPSPKLQYNSSPVQTLLPGWTSDTRCSLSPNLSLVPFAPDWTPWMDPGLCSWLRCVWDSAQLLLAPSSPHV